MAQTRSVIVWPTAEETANAVPSGAPGGWQAVVKPASAPDGPAPDGSSFIAFQESVASTIERLVFVYSPLLASTENITWARLWVYAGTSGDRSLRAHIEYRSGSAWRPLGGRSPAALQLSVPANARAGWYSTERVPARRSARRSPPLRPSGRLYVRLHSDAQPGTVIIWAVAIELGVSTMSLVNVDHLGMNQWVGGYSENTVPVYGIQYGGDGAVDDPVNPGWGCWWEHQDVPEFLASMKSWHWNTLRVALPIGLFMADRTTPNVARFRRLVAFLDECERCDIRVILTGQLWNPSIRDPNDWGLESLTEAARWAWRQRFWFNLAKYCGSSPTVLLYDFASECGFTHTKRYRRSWYSAPLCGYHFGEFLARTNANHSPPTVNQAAVDFIAMMTDPTHGTTACDVTPRSSVGRLFAVDGGWSEVDSKGLTSAFMPHIYPCLGQARSALAEWLTANGSHGGLPVVLEESGNLLGASAEELIEMWGGISQRPGSALAGSLSFAPSYVTPAHAVDQPVGDRRAHLTLTNALTYLRALPLALHQQGKQPLPRVAQRIFGRRQLYPRCAQRL